MYVKSFRQSRKINFEIFFLSWNSFKIFFFCWNRAEDFNWHSLAKISPGPLSIWSPDHKIRPLNNLDWLNYI
jgi:hypothetical protein